MSNRKLFVLSAVFLALLAFVMLFERHQPSSEEAAQARRRLVDFKPEDVAALTIERSDLPKLELKKTGERWMLAGEPGGPADKASIDALISDLNRLEIVGMTRTKFDPKEFGLDAPKAKVTIHFKDKSQKSIAFGKEVPGFDATAAAESNHFGAVKYAPLAALSKPIEEFRSKTLVEVPASEITRVTIQKGQSKIVVSREVNADKTPGPWNMEAPVKDLASQSFVEQLLGDITAAHITEYPSIPASDLAKVGLQPPNGVITLQKGNEVVSNVAFGAAKADTTGKIFARRDNVVVVVDDRIQEDLAKEFSAFRESKICPTDTWSVTRVVFAADALRAGAERLEGEWRTAGKTVPSSAAEDLIDRVTRAEAMGFIARKDYATNGIVAAKGKNPTPLATIELTTEKSAVPKVVSFLAAGDKRLAVEVTGRAEAMLVERALLDELKAAAEHLKKAADAPSPAVTPAAPAAPVTKPTSRPATKP
ncbi:MAG: DUF4340 domain-containing protein [Thermoanaerobaculia bacterium]